MTIILESYYVIVCITLCLLLFSSLYCTVVPLYIICKQVLSVCCVTLPTHPHLLPSPFLSLLQCMYVYVHVLTALLLKVCISLYYYYYYYYYCGCLYVYQFIQMSNF